MNAENPILNEIREMYREARAHWHTDMAYVLSQLSEFAGVLERNLGEISRDEAISAMKRRADELIEELR